jgi:hypothetical protein
MEFPHDRLSEGDVPSQRKFVLVRYEKNTMVLPNEDYERKGYQPRIADLPTKEEWLKQFDANGEYILPKRP